MKSGEVEARVRVLHIITRLIVGGAQENTLITVRDLDPALYETELLCGPQLGSEGSLFGEAERDGLAVFVEPALVREVSPLKDLRALIRLFLFIRRGRYEIVHTHSSKAGILGRLAARLAGVPHIVHTVHGWGHNERQRPGVRRFYILLERFSLLFTDRLVAVTVRDIEKGLRDGIGRRGDYELIRSGIDLGRYGSPERGREELRRELGLPLDAQVVGTVIRMSPQKAPLDFVEAAARVIESRPDARFLMVGDGPLRPEVEERAAELGIAEKIVFTGLRADVPELLSVMDVFALSSLWEGLPRVILQAMAAGVPVVASSVDGNTEIVRDEETGLLVSPGDAGGLAGAILVLLEEPEKGERLAGSAREGLGEFSAERMVSDIGRLYGKLLGS